MGASQVMVQGIEVVDLILDKNVILVKGGIPGAQNSTLFIRNANKSA
jgi:large subunit ribosomal protein L3